MKWLISKGNSVNVNIYNYKIDWDKAAPSAGAQIVKDFLKFNCKHDSLTEEFRIPKTKLRCDFINWSKKFVLEFDGKQHQNFSKFMHGSRSGFLASVKRDLKKDELLELNGLTVIRVTEKDLPLTKEFFEKYEIYL